MHFGRGDLAKERAHESALISCIRYHEDKLDHLVLVGDVFDQYIEYKNLVPKGFVRFQGLLAELTDRNCQVSYLIGNHDPWHIDYFQEELGVKVIFAPITEPLNEKLVYLNHGDMVGSRFPLYTLIKHTLQHPVPVFLYRTLMPGDLGFRLARWVNGRLHSDVINEAVVKQLQEHAEDVLTKKLCDLVVMGHSHQAELTSFDKGLYLNTGCWHLHRTFACLFEQEVTLFKWNDDTNRPSVLKNSAFQQESETSV